jgi:GT2 family glycosyltransferase
MTSGLSSDPVDRERDRLEACLSLALRALEGVTPPIPAPPPPFESDYGLDAAEDDDGYARWLARKSSRWCAPRSGREGEPDLPAIGVVVASVDEPDMRLMERSLDSVVAQTYPAWELCVGQVGRAGAHPDAGAALDQLASRLAAGDPRVRSCPPAEGAVGAANSAAGLVRSPFIAFLGAHDELTPTALAVVAEALARHPDTDVLYTDEDEADDGGGLSRPRFKPDWSPDLLLSTMYVGHLLVVRRSLFEEVGGLRPEFEGSEFFDLALRATERARRIEHVAEVCYHRRVAAGLRDGDGDGDGTECASTDRAARAALESALCRRQEQATVEAGLCRGTYRVRRAIRSAPLVSILVPFRDGSELLRRCIASVHRTSGYDRWELVLIDNQSWEPETAAMLQRLETDPKCRVVPFPHPYNWSALNNFGAAHSNGDLLLFLNSDVEGRSQGWLAAMVERAQCPDVGAVGARLLYPDGSVQHAGVVIDLGRTVSWHAFWKCPGDGPGYLGYAKTIRNYSAVTGACMMVRRDAFDAVGGMDETLAICFNDVELCLRMRAEGKLVVYTPFAELFHYESSTRGVALEQEEIDMMRRRWGDVIVDDPYFNPNLDRNRAEFALPR